MLRKKYLDMYAGQNAAIAAFYGMITNIDDNVGRTRALLKELGIYENTIFIFTTDNGTASGEKVFNAGMRGKKGSEYDGGHRVPFMLHWPGAGLNKRHVANTLAHAVDILPTMLDMAGIEKPASLEFDGTSIQGLLDPQVKVNWADRFLITDSQRVRDPIKWRKSAVMSQRWRLINGTELYDIEQDPGQTQDVAQDHLGQVAQMRKFYEQWWAELEPTFSQTTEIHLGHPDHQVATLTGHDWIQQSGPPWNQAHIRSGHNISKALKGNEKTTLKHSGHWAVKVLHEGTYNISLLRWPVEANHSITAGLPAKPNVPGASTAFRARPGVSIPITSATLRIDGTDLETKPVAESDVHVTFTVELSKGSHELAPVFHVGESELGAFYAVVKKR